MFDAKGYTFLVDKSLAQTAGPITVDGSPYGFKISSNMKMENSGGCSSCTSC